MVRFYNGGGENLEMEQTDDVVDGRRADGVDDVDRQLQDEDCQQQGHHRFADGQQPICCE